MPRAPRKEQMRKLICESCRSRKQKCTLSNGATPSSTPLPDGQRCRGCQQRGVECVFARRDLQQHLSQQPSAPIPPSTTSAAGSPSSAQGRAKDSGPSAQTATSFQARSTREVETSSASLKYDDRHDAYTIGALTVSMSAMLLREPRFATHLSPRKRVSWDAGVVVGRLNILEIDELLEVMRLFFPSFHSYASVLTTWYRASSKASANLLLHTLLWLVSPRLDWQPASYNSVLKDNIQDLSMEVLATEDRADGALAAQAFDLLFGFWPLALTQQRPASSRSGTLALGNDVLSAALRLGLRSPALHIHRRIYCTALVHPRWPDEDFRMRDHLPSGGSLNRLGVVLLRHRAVLANAVKAYERKVGRREARFGQPFPTDELAIRLEDAFEAFIAGVAAVRQDFAQDLGKQASGLDAHRYEQQAKRCLLAWLEQLSLTFSIALASHIAAVSLRMTAAPLDKAAAKRALARPGSRVLRLSSTLARYMAQSLTQSLALTPLISECKDVVWAVPTTERAMILCATTKHLIQRLAGLIYFEHKKPKQLEQTILLLEAAGRTAVADAGSRTEDNAISGPRTEEGAIREAIDYGNTLVTAGRIAQRASSALRAWRDRLDEESCSREMARSALPLIEVDGLLRTPGLFCDDHFGLEGKSPVYQHEQRKERLLAQLWVASRGEEE